MGTFAIAGAKFYPWVSSYISGFAASRASSSVIRTPNSKSGAGEEAEENGAEPGSLAGAELFAVTRLAAARDGGGSLFAEQFAVVEISLFHGVSPFISQKFLSVWNPSGDKGE